MLQALELNYVASFHRVQQKAGCSSQLALAEQGRGWPDVLRTWQTDASACQQRTASSNCTSAVVWPEVGSHQPTLCHPASQVVAAELTPQHQLTPTVVYRFFKEQQAAAPPLTVHIRWSACESFLW
jgi:hypothetical protein